MPAYVYECPAHGRFEVVKPVADAGRAESCRCARPARRIYTPSGLIVRPSGWHLRPGDKGYSDFRRERELGELRAPAPFVRQRDDPDDRLPDPVITYTEDQRYELAQMSQVVDRAVLADPDIPKE